MVSDDDDEEARSSFHDAALFANSHSRLADLVGELSRAIERKISLTSSRAPPRTAVERRKEAIDNQLANLSWLVLSPGYKPANRLAIATAKTKPTRYDRSIVNRRIVAPMIAALQAEGMIIVHPAIFKQRLTTIEPTQAFLNELACRNVGLSDLRRDDLGETIILSARSRAEGRFGEPAPRDRIDYEDNEDSIQYRGEMGRINTFLNSATLKFDGVAQAQMALRRTFLLRSPDDVPTFKLNGRLVGGWWLSLPSRERHRITLNGEGLADLDFKAMFIQLAYRRDGDVLREGFDPYALPGLEGYRNGAKKAMLSLLGRTGAMRKLSPELKGLLPEGWTAKRVVAAARELHTDIQHLFGKDVGVELMFIESQILVAVLLRLADNGIPALPMHDGIMVAESQKVMARQIMGQVSAEMLGAVPLPVSEKAIGRPNC